MEKEKEKTPIEIVAERIKEAEKEALEKIKKGQY